MIKCSCISVYINACLSYMTDCPGNNHHHMVMTPYPPMLIFYVQVFGGNGFNSEYPVEKLMRDAKIYQVSVSSFSCKWEWLCDHYGYQSFFYEIPFLGWSCDIWWHHELHFMIYIWVQEAIVWWYFFFFFRHEFSSVGHVLQLLSYMFFWFFLILLFL